MLLEELLPQEEPDERPNFKIYVDMDGVLADFEVGIGKLLGDGYDDAKYNSDSKYRSDMWRAVSKYSKEGGQLWSELPMMSDAKELWNYVEQYNPEILTAGGNPAYGAEAQKRRWVPWVLGSNAKVHVVRKSADKAQFATTDSILIDDQKKSIDPWVAAGGIGILHKSAADTINKLKELGL